MAASKRMDKMERDFEADEDARALKRLAAMKNDKKRLQRARAKVESERKELQGATDMASGLRRNKSTPAKRR